MECLKGCICGKPVNLEDLIAKKDVAGMTTFTRSLQSEDLQNALLTAAELGDANCETDYGSRPLHEAVKAGSIEMVVRLIRAGAMLDAKDKSQETALDVAKGLGDKQMQRVLLKESSKKKTDQFVDGMEFVSKVSIFSTLHPAEYPRLAAAFVSKTYHPGDVIIRQGEAGNEMFFIRRGNAEVLVQGGSGEEPVKVNVLGAEDYFGEAALINETPRNATIVAATDMEVKTLSRTDFQALDLRKKLKFVKRKAVHQSDDEKRAMQSHLLVKTPAQQELVRSAIMANSHLGSLLKHLGAKEVDDIVGAAFAMDVEPGAEVIKQGDLKADLFFVVEQGDLDVIINGKKVHEYGAGGSFGELALLFRAPRAATVKARGAAKLWAIQRQDLRLLMQARLKKKLGERAAMLGRMEAMKNVPDEDKAQLADALVEAAYSAGEFIIKQGEEGQTFFILYEGEVAVIVNGKEVARLAGEPTSGKFEFFGERALETDEPRAASVKVLSSRAVCLALDRGVYMRVRGMSLKVKTTPGTDFCTYKRDELQTLGLLGCGGFGVVTLVKCNTTGNTFALKALSKGHVVSQGQERSVMNEKGILRMTHSPFLIRLAATFNSDQHLYFLLEPAMGGELFTVYQRMGFHGSMKHGRFYVACVVRGFEHLHQRQIIYRDLKPENLLLDAQGYCKVTDFGLAKFVIGHAYTTCGTPDYFAPEMVLGLGHTNAVDWWTLGVLIYELMMGDTPFTAQDTMHTFRKIQRGIEACSFPGGSPWVTLVKTLCRQEPSERLPMRKGPKAVEEHDWYSSFNWESFGARTMIAPYVPKVKSASDMDNFDAHQEDAPPTIPYANPGTGWDNGFEDPCGPTTFD